MSGELGGMAGTKGMNSRLPYSETSFLGGHGGVSVHSPLPRRSKALGGIGQQGMACAKPPLLDSRHKTSRQWATAASGRRVEARTLDWHLGTWACSAGQLREVSLRNLHLSHAVET